MPVKRKKKAFDGIIRVLCVNLEGSVAGAEQSLLQLVKLKPDNVQISAACPNGILAKKLNHLKIITYKISSPPHRFNNISAWFLHMAIVNLQLFFITLKTKPQIIHANSSKAILAAALARFFTGAKLIWHMRDWKCSKLQATLCSCLSSKIIAVSSSVKARLISLGIQSQLVEVIYNGITPKNIETTQVRTQPFTFVNIGQFVPWKKQLLFINAAQIFLQEGYKANFILIGDDVFARDAKYKKELIKNVMQSQFAQNIKIISWQDKLDSFWPKFDCLVHTANAEPFGRVIIEAMAHCIPIIAAAGGGPAEIIANGKTGLLFAPDDVDELLVAIKLIYQDKELARTLALNAKEHITSTFGASKTAKRIAEVYMELMAA